MVDFNPFQLKSYSVERDRERAKGNPIVFALVAALMLAGGCSGGKYAVEPVEGTVTFEGKPISWGTVLFVPKAPEDSEGFSGKAAAGPVDEQGRYRLTTYAVNDGAIVGSHSVRFIYQFENNEIGERYKAFFAGLGMTAPKSLKPKIKSVEVKDGKNVIDIELIGK